MDLKNKYILYTESQNKVLQYFCHSESECYNLVQDLKTINYKIYKAKDCVSNFFADSIEWDFEKKDIKINIEKAKEIKRNQYRILRISLLNDLDIKFMKAIEENDQVKVQKVVELKNKLRDVTALNLPEVASELLNFYPSCFIEAALYLYS